MTKYATKLIGLTTTLFAIGLSHALGDEQDTSPSVAAELEAISPAGSVDQYVTAKFKYYNESLKFEEIHAAALSGDAQAQYKLGHIYHLGQGVTKSDVVALMWYVISTKNGVDSADRDRKLTENYMAFDQISLAYQMAEQWISNSKN